MSERFPVLSTCLSGFFLSACMCQVSHNTLSMLDLSFKQETFHLFSSNSPLDNYNQSVGIEIMFKEHVCFVISDKMDSFRGVCVAVGCIW